MPLDPLEETRSLSNSYYYWCDMLDVTWGVGIESDQLCLGNRELPGVGCRVMSGSRLWESLVTEVGKHFLTYTVRALLAECLVSLRCPKLNKIIIVFRKFISCLRFSLSESKNGSGQCLEREKSQVGSGRGMAAVGDREGHSAFQTFPNPLDVLQSQRLCVEFECCLLRGSVSFSSLWDQNSHTLSKIAGPNGYWVNTQTLVTHLVLALCDSLGQNNKWKAFCSSPTKW